MQRDKKRALGKSPLTAQKKSAYVAFVHVTDGGALGRNGSACVIGAANVDIGGSSVGSLKAGDSNPGRVRISLGGVGFNIARNMALLGLNVRLVTIFGGDASAKEIKEACTRLGIDTSLSATMPNERTPAYLFIADERGDMALALNDMEIYSHLTPDVIAASIGALNSSTLIAIDANISADTIDYIAQHCTAPIFADPVSAAKCERLLPVLGKLHTLKPNKIEAETLSGVEMRGTEACRRAAEKLLKTGLERVFVTLGADGAYAAERGGAEVFLPALPARGKSSTGCGDAFTAALALAWQMGLSLEKSAAAGLAAASIAMESAETVNPIMSRELLKKRMEENRL